MKTYRRHPPTIVEYIFFSYAHKLDTKGDHVLGSKTNINKFLKIEII